eukprot:CAMPEP_0172444106 /NCGR_PEP_ID=MMETSP1065-20121228/4215_1 /TAXON_ID=265537 /ORGANISM="Amphiprora paludosa, Strain CCMP125" /LENGTH=395 /DNA_ID=CAMNT_0013194525 /DNA_START=42 /DNA_END=1229 /DNA_ORIENTATION=-
MMRTVSVVCALLLLRVDGLQAFQPSFSTSSTTRSLPTWQRHGTIRSVVVPTDAMSYPTTTTTTSKSSLSMSVEGDFDPEALEKAREEAQSGSVKARVKALYKFTRPHTIRGTILASFAGTTRALLDTPGALTNPNWGIMLPRAFVGMFALLLGNAFIVGINQIYDEDIDKMNKPFLPVASGEMSKRFAWLAVVFSGGVGPVIVKKFFPPLLFKLYSFGLFLGLVYSVPPIRTKQNPILAGLTIATVRGFLLNFGVYFAVKDAVGAAFSWSPKVSFIARFMTMFASVIAITKDLPDVEGDKAYNIETFATKVGVGRIAKGATVCLMVNYIHALATGLLAKPGTFKMIPMIGGHLAGAAILLARFRQLEPDSIKSIKLYYKHIWDLFYMEYALYTLI